MSMPSKRARKLADILMGLEDAKREILDLYKESMDLADETLPIGLIEAAERWQDLSDELQDWYEGEL